jgi:nicotinate-nucleotide adenylyltransferase
VTIGLLGGTFDPFHRGHLDVARAAIEVLRLAEIWIVPARMPPHRDRPLASAAHRFAMAALAIQEQPALRLSDLEMDTAGPSYTTETLDRLSAAGVDPGGLCFITGADAFLEIRSWKGYPRLLDRCHFAVVSRPGTPAGRMRAALPELADRMVDVPAPSPSRPSILLVDVGTAPVSSTDVRQARADGRPLTDLVPPAVAAYIDRHRLYAASSVMPERIEDPA